jgi:hypothetical protein
MTTDPNRVAEKIQNAIEATSAFVSTLRAENLAHWQTRFEEIETALRSGDAPLAIRLDQQILVGGMGSLSDHYAENQREFDQRWGACSKSIANLRIYLEFEIDRPTHSSNA